mgnify:CR=1 FL=1
MVKTRFANIPFDVARRTLAVMETYGVNGTNGSTHGFVKKARVALKKEVSRENKCRFNSDKIHIYASFAEMQEDPKLKVGSLVGLYEATVEELDFANAPLVLRRRAVRHAVFLDGSSDPRRTLELKIKGANGASLLYPYCRNNPAALFGVAERTRLADPLLGAEVGDKLKVYIGLLAESSKIFIAQPWHVQNDAHYERSSSVLSRAI